jgi:hypothetical protein
MSHIFVPVVDQECNPLMPTTASRARKWIKSGKATHFWKGGLFCVRLSQATSESQAEQEETPAFHQGTLALETAPGDVSVPTLPGERLCGGRHQSPDQIEQASLE